jgi:hypothetical protein
MIPLAATLDFVAPTIPIALVAPEADRRLRVAANRLPASLAHWIFIECHLATPTRADLTVGVDVADAVALRTLERWRRLAAFGRLWNDARTCWHEQVDRLWLEFDLDGQRDAGPSVFAELRSRESWEAIANTADHFRPAGRSLLDRCIDRLPRSARVLYAGLFFPRGWEAVRLCIVGLADAEIPPYLAAVGWPGHTDALIAELTRWRTIHGVGVGVLDLDVGADVAPAIGLEYMFRRDVQVSGRLGDSELLDSLVRTGWCDEAQRNALETWPHSMRAVMPHELWESVIHRRLNHVKLTFAHDRVREVKAYLSIGQAARIGESTQ